MPTMTTWRPGQLLRDVVAETIREAIIYCGGNKRRAAAMLGISNKTLYNWTRDHDRLAEFYNPKPKLRDSADLGEL